MTTAEYNTCVDNHADGVYRFVLKNLGDRERAQDIVQEAFSRMWEKAADISSAKAKSYLFTTAYHTMIDDIRREKKLSRMDETHAFEVPVTSHGYSDLKEVLEEALSRLPDIQKTVVMLRDYEGYSYEEIGEITGLNASQVKVYIYRARVTLKNYIGQPDRVI
ncbi:MAG: RNA polymerase sigma factor [Lentimicrobium sp.]|jgi:RNA polymerase sigma-70 factor (ECF subfamily)|nr:RNA polymerase sigma factor [Lentimicrobium sp.]MDD2526999.1 RNA polymerase sigma factor [Lentimicrobiaceae bacterium]MDD4598780.1 RNA polymerase sigma factor [Lentimicrobiaceae bacterium]MDY0025013.1 RNA polymerase sigma factor [Lentimicrobium sp.]HAH57694.1 RNA polymerase sigma factor [Bacteroidales bacterium]